MNSVPIRASGEQRTPIYFGSPDHRLFGCIHEPATGPRLGRGVVLCYPFGQEYIRAHRSFTQLAARLAGMGLSVLRFDYFGCGDSSGDLEDATVQGWTDDVSAAVAELRHRSGATAMSLLGLRMGAAIAAIAASRRTDIDSLVLWDPLVRGPSYLAEIARVHSKMLELAYLTLPGSNGAPGAEVSGFPLSPRLREGIEAIDLLTLQGVTVDRTLVLESERRSEGAALHAHLQSLPIHCDHLHVPERKVWLRERSGGIVPLRLLDTIARWLSRERS